MIERKQLPPSADPEPSLEQRLGAALDDKTATTATLAALVAECEKTIDEVESAWKAAFDARRWPDPKEALAYREGCAFRADRLRSLLMQLQTRHRQVAKAERLAQWHAECDELQFKRDALAAEWALYPEVVARIVDLVTRSKAFDEELSRLHQARPSGVSRHLLGAELVARGLEEFNRDNPTIARDLQLPDWNNSGTTAWPPPRQHDPSVFMLPPDPRADWSSPEAQAAAEARTRAERERIGKYYEQQTRAQEERINREERERFAKRRR